MTNLGKSWILRKYEKWQFQEETQLERPPNQEVMGSGLAWPNWEKQEVIGKSISRMDLPQEVWRSTRAPISFICSGNVQKGSSSFRKILRYEGSEEVRADLIQLLLLQLVLASHVQVIWLQRTEEIFNLRGSGLWLRSGTRNEEAENIFRYSKLLTPLLGIDPRKRACPQTCDLSSFRLIKYKLKSKD